MLYNARRRIHMKKDRYIYPAIFNHAKDGISIEFPDLPGCFPSADTTEEAFKNAKEALALHLYSMEYDNDPIPQSSDIYKIKKTDNQAIVLIEVWMPPYRDEIEKRSS